MFDKWSRVLAQILWTGLRLQGKPHFGEPVRIDHPGRDRPKRKITTDPEAIKRFFSA